MLLTKPSMLLTVGGGDSNALFVHGKGVRSNHSDCVHELATREVDDADHAVLAKTGCAHRGLVSSIVVQLVAREVDDADHAVLACT